MKKMQKVLIAFIALFTLTACGSKMQMKDYTDVKFTGPNGDGLVTAEFDYERFAADLAGTLKDPSLLDYGMIYDSAKMTVDKTEGVKNGDTITINYSISDKYKKVKTSPMKVKVEGLKDPVELSNEEILKNLETTFSGISGKGSLALSFKDDTYPFSSINMKVENNGELENGSKAKINLDLPINVHAEDEVYVLANDFIEIEVEGLTDIPKDLSKVSNLDSFKTVMKETIENDFSLSRQKIEFINFYYRAALPNDPAITSGGGWGSDFNQFGEIATLVKRTVTEGYNEGDVAYYMYISGENTVDNEKLSLKKAQSLSKHSFTETFGFDTIETIIAEDHFQVIK